MNGKDSISYEIHYTKTAEKFFRKNEEVREQFRLAIETLIVGEHPEQIDVKRIQGKKSNFFRIRLGENRVIYTVINGKVVAIMVILAGARGDVYKKMKGK